jgi:two-component system chemotaxis sensor kinase CheA
MSELEGMEEVLREFLVESYENLDQFDRELVELEKAPSSREILSSIFRTIHTIKGTSGFLGFSELERVTHAGENLLSRLRDGRIALTPAITTALLSTGDAVRRILGCVEASGQEGVHDFSGLVATLTGLLEPPPAEESAEVPRIGEILVSQGKTSLMEVASALIRQNEGDPRRVGELLVEKGAVTPGAVLDALQTQEAKASAVSDTVLRVDVGLLDKLMDLVGELVLARNQILQHSARASEDGGFAATVQRLNLITTELQEGIMKTRMQPIGNIWNKLPRVVRDLAASLGKQVRLVMDGEETELDKTIIEAIKDPLTHIVRNAADHGIESAEKRRAAGKPAEGLVVLRAFHEGGQVNIEVSDDGGGINVARVRQKAIDQGLVSADQAARLTERDVLQLLFVPGFSTAERVTNVSGRGVGLDVVRSNIERISGSVDLDSQPGLGTSVRIKIPLTLAIIPALVVMSGGDRYAIPQVSLVELVRLEGAAARKGIERIHGAPVYRLRGHLLPLVFLQRELARGAGGPIPLTSDTVNIVVLQADDRQFGLVVEGINDTEEIVVKPLGKHLKGIPVFAGATIMGDGRVALILDVLGLAQRARVVSQRRDKGIVDSRVQGRAHDGSRQSLLLFGVGETGRLAIPLSMVARLEEFPRVSIEHAADHDVVQYRGRIMPLIDVGALMPGYGQSTGATDDPVQAIVYSHHGRSVGLIVRRILDIVDDTVVCEEGVTHEGILGSAVVGGRVTDFLDVHGIVEAAMPGYFRLATERAGDA